MSEFERETDQVLAFSYRSHGPGGELPAAAITYIPADRAERVTALDRRIENAKRIMPLLIGGLFCLGTILAAAQGWMKPGFAALVAAAAMLQGMGKYAKEVRYGQNQSTQ